MLTKNDLNLIKGIVKVEINSSLDAKLDEKLKPITKRLDRIEKKLDNTIDVFDRHELEIVKNVRVIQKHVGLPIMEFA